MTNGLRHRGPDDEGTYLSPDNMVALGNRRLAIRDLSPAGHMPMGNNAGTVWITYNGEIYNTDEIRTDLERMDYRFDSESDTEVILHGYEAWGVGVVDRLRGMFAFAILDMRQTIKAPVLILVRDRLGIKPLYYARTSAAFLFSSELKGILASGLVSHELSSAGLVGYLMMGSVPNPLTIYRDMQALEPGCILTLSLNYADMAPELVRYWSMPTDEVESVSHADAVEKVRALLEESVRIQLVSDVPLGAFLSGGLDSSAVVALIRQATDGPIRTCSMIFEESEYSEARYARAMAEAAGSDHYEQVITARDVVDEFDNIVQAMDQPSNDGVNTFFVSKTAREAGLTVALSGLGGDELFGGYDSIFEGVPRILRSLRLAHRLRGGARMLHTATALLPERQGKAKMRDALLRPVSPASAYLTRRGFFAPSEVRALVEPDIWYEALQTFDPVQHIADRASSGGRATVFNMEWLSRAELATYTHHQLLRDTDAMSMANSIEVRVPLLDHRLVEYLLRLPTSAKVSGKGPKSLLLSAMGNDLPPAIRDRQVKVGFTFPFELWLRGNLRNKVDHSLHALSSQPVMQGRSVQAVWQQYCSGRAHWSRVWMLVALQGAYDQHL